MTWKINLMDFFFFGLHAIYYFSFQKCLLINCLATSSSVTRCYTLSLIYSMVLKDGQYAGIQYRVLVTVCCSKKTLVFSILDDFWYPDTIRDSPNTVLTADFSLVSVGHCRDCYACFCFSFFFSSNASVHCMLGSFSLFLTFCYSSPPHDSALWSKAVCPVYKDKLLMYIFHVLKPVTCSAF